MMPGRYRDDIDGGCGGIASVSQRIGIKAKPGKDGICIRRCQLCQGAGYLPVGEGVNGFDPLLSPVGKKQQLDTVILPVRLLQNIS